MTTNFFSPLSFVAVFGSGIRDPGWVKIWIRDPGCLSRIRHTRLWAAFGIMRLLWDRDARVWPVKLFCRSASPSCHSDADTDPTFDLDADPAFHPLDADLDPAPHQRNANLRPMVYRPSITPFWASTPLLWASPAFHGSILSLHISWILRIRIRLLIWCGSGSGFPKIMRIQNRNTAVKCELQLIIWYWVLIPTYRFGEISVGLPGVEVQAGGVVVLNHPGEHRVLSTDTYL